MLAGLAGLEHAAGIPGSIGGAVYMNAGSLRQLLSNRISSVTAMDSVGTVQRFAVQECGFGYRTSAFHGRLRGWTILGCEFLLVADSGPAIRRRMLEILAARRRKFPRKLPNCGSVFKGVADHATFGPPGRIIESVGLKGRTLGTVRVSEQHANFIVHDGHGTSEDFLKLMRLIQETVARELGVELTPEVEYVAPA